MSYNGLGLVAEYKRDIVRNSPYEKYFHAPPGNDVLLHRNGNIYDTVKSMAKIAFEKKDTVKDLAKALEKPTIAETLKSDFDFVFSHVQYTLDTPGHEQLRSPLRALKDRFKGVDCDCYSILLSALLQNQHGGIDHSFRITKYTGDWQHVYIVAKDQSGKKYILDCVLDKFNYEKPYTQNKDFPMTKVNGLGIPVSMLDGFGDAPEVDIVDIASGSAFDGLGDSADNAASLQKYNACTKAHLIQTRDYIAKNPASLAEQDINPEAYLKMLNYAIENWDTPNRQNALNLLAKEEDKWNDKNATNGIGEVEEDAADDQADRFQIDSLSCVNGLGTILDADPEEFDKEWNQMVSGLGKPKIKRGPKKFFKRLANAHKAFRRKHGKAGKRIAAFLVTANPLALLMKKKHGKNMKHLRDKRMAAGKGGIQQAIKNNLVKNKAVMKGGKDASYSNRALPGKYQGRQANRKALYNGFGEADELTAILSDTEIDGLGNTGNEEQDQKQYTDAILQKITQTRDYISRNPASLVSQGIKPDAYLKMLNYAIEKWNTPDRDNALLLLSKEEERWQDERDMAGLGSPDADDFQEDQAQMELDTETGVAGFGNILDADPEEFEHEWNQMTSGVGDLGKGKKKKKKPGFFKRIANGIKVIGKKIGKAAKKVLQVINRINPLFAVIRGGIILAMKVNLFNMAGRLLSGLYSLDEAKKHGVSEDVWNRSKKAYEKVKKFWENFGGKAKNLEKAIKHKADKKKWKKAAHLKGFYENAENDLQNFNGLGEFVTLAAIITAATAIVTLIAKIASAFKGVKQAAAPVQQAEGFGEGDEESIEEDQVDTFADAGEGEQKKDGGWVKKFIDMLKKVFKGNPKKKAARKEKRAAKKAEKAAKTTNPKKKEKLLKDAEKLKQSASKLKDEANGKLSATQLKAQQIQANSTPGSPEYLNAATAELVSSEAANTSDNPGASVETIAEGAETKQAGMGMFGTVLLIGAAGGGLLLMNSGGKGKGASRSNSSPSVSGLGKHTAKKEPHTKSESKVKVEKVLLR